MMSDFDLAAVLHTHLRSLTTLLRQATPMAPASSPRAAHRQDQLFVNLTKVVARDGFEVCPGEATTRSDGSIVGHKIYVANNDHKVITLAHEYAHVLLGSQATCCSPVPRRVGESAAEAVAYLVMSYYHLPVWCCLECLAFEQTTAADITPQAETIIVAATTVIRRLDNLSSE